MGDVQPHDVGRKRAAMRAVDTTCEHTWTLDGGPPAHCGFCGVWWPGYTPHAPHRGDPILADYQATERDGDPRLRAPHYTGRRGFTSNWKPLD